MTMDMWIELLEQAYSGRDLKCPTCGGHIEASLFANDSPDGKRGFAVLACKSCKSRHEFSRVKFPEYANTQPL